MKIWTLVTATFYESSIILVSDETVHELDISVVTRKHLSSALGVLCYQSI